MSSDTDLAVFDRRESEVRGYIRSFPTVFDRAMGSTLVDADGREYLDFFAGAGVLNYGHNNPAFTRALIEYLERDGIIHGLDMATSRRRRSSRRSSSSCSRRAGSTTSCSSPGPTGANAVEAALKVARQATGRSTVVAFTNAFHGLSLGALAVTGNSHYRAAAGVGLDDVARLPYDGYLGADVDTLDLLEKMLDDPGSGLDLPAAVIVEAVQGEGGINVAAPEWLQRLRAITAARGILLILDEIQAGVGRTGAFFAFEERASCPTSSPCRSRSRARPAHVAPADAPRGRRLEAGPAHGHVPRQQPRVRLRARRARDLLGGCRVHRGRRREVGAAPRRLERIAAGAPRPGLRGARPRPHVGPRVRHRPHPRRPHLGRGVPSRPRHRDVGRPRRGAEVPAGAHDHARTSSAGASPSFARASTRCSPRADTRVRERRAPSLGPLRRQTATASSRPFSSSRISGTSVRAPRPAMSRKSRPMPRPSNQMR